MRVSTYFKLQRNQPTLDFVDVDISNDARFFIDPRALRLLPSAWGAECVSLVQDFFQHVLKLISSGDDHRARELLGRLREPNETHLGLSRDRARGRGLGAESARDVWEALSASEAVKSGLLEDLEDTILMVEGIGPDIVSDITTNLIREPFIRYTADACTFYEIPMGEVDSGPLWDPAEKNWYSEFVRLPVAENRKLLLVPKVIVRRRMDYDQDEYYRDYILEFLTEEEIKSGSSLVQLLKNGRTRVTKKDLIAKYGSGKKTIIRETRRVPEILEQYRQDKRDQIQHPLTHDDLSHDTNTAPPNWNDLLHAVRNVAPGNEGASDYHRAVEALLAALFYPSLCNPQREVEIHGGRKRIDITFTNAATHGFFHWLGQHYPAPHVFVECKNYSREIANPELDQMAGRFSPSRGQFGLIVCRSFEEKGLFVLRCRDTARDHRGFIIALDDDDLGRLAEEANTADRRPTYGILKDRFDQLVL